MEHKIVTQELTDDITITQHTTNKKRYYTIKGDPGIPETAELPSVTTITGIFGKPFLTPWAVKIATQQMTEMTTNLFNGQYRNSVGVGAAVSSHRTLLFITAREWLRCGEEFEVVVEELQRLNEYLRPGARLETGEIRQLVEGTDRIARNERYNAFTDSIKQIAEVSKKEPDFVGKVAADIGTEVHEEIEDFILKGQFKEYKDESYHEVTNAYYSFLDWWDDVGNRPPFRGVRLTEAMVYHPMGFAGTIDAVFETTSGDIILIDWKTSKSIYDDYAVQLGAYALGYEYVYEKEPISARVVRFDKGDNLKWSEKEVDLVEAKAHFYAALSAYDYQQDRKDLWK